MDIYDDILFEGIAVLFSFYWLRIIIPKSIVENFKWDKNWTKAFFYVIFMYCRRIITWYNNKRQEKIK